MTIGIARKFGRRVIILTDTMISDSDVGRADAIPGRLKAVILSPNISIAYAGDANPALAAIRRARDQFTRNGKISTIADILAEASVTKDHSLANSSNSRGVDFILVCHDEGIPSLRKITSYGISSELDGCFIGDARIANQVGAAELKESCEGIPEIDISAEELRFRAAFMGLFSGRGIQIGDGVGGFPICLLASPYGHTYQASGSAIVWDMVQIPGGVTADQHQARRSGMTEWQFSLVRSRLRGVPVLGAALPQIGLGIVYSPLEQDEAECFSLGLPAGSGFVDACPLLEALNSRVNQVAETIGGGIAELD